MESTLHGSASTSSDAVISPSSNNRQCPRSVYPVAELNTPVDPLRSVNKMEPTLRGNTSSDAVQPSLSNNRRRPRSRSILRDPEHAFIPYVAYSRSVYPVAELNNPADPLRSVNKMVSTLHENASSDAVKSPSSNYRQRHRSVVRVPEPASTPYIARPRTESELNAPTDPLRSVNKMKPILHENASSDAVKSPSSNNQQRPRHRSVVRDPEPASTPYIARPRTESELNAPTHPVDLPCSVNKMESTLHEKTSTSSHDVQSSLSNNRRRPRPRSVVRDPGPAFTPYVTRSRTNALRSVNPIDEMPPAPKDPQPAVRPAKKRKIVAKGNVVTPLTNDATTPLSSISVSHSIVTSSQNPMFKKIISLETRKHIEAILQKRYSSARNDAWNIDNQTNSFSFESVCGNFLNSEEIDSAVEEIYNWMNCCYGAHRSLSMLKSLRYISEVLLPEAFIFAIGCNNSISPAEAEQFYLLWINH